MSCTTVASDAGQIWPSKPVVSASGIVSNIKQSNSVSSAALFRCIAFSAKASSFVAGGNGLFVFFVKDNRYARLDRSKAECTSLCGNPVRNEEFAAGYADGSIKLHNTQTSKPEAHLRGHRTSVRSLAYNSVGDHLLSVDLDQTIVWSSQAHTRIRTIPSQPQPVTRALFLTSDDTVVTVHKDGVLAMWPEDHKKGPAGRVLEPAIRPQPDSTLLAVSPDGHWIVTSASRPLLFVWDVQTAKLLYAVHLSMESDSLQLAFLPDSRSVAVLSADNSLTVVDIIKAEALYSIESVSEQPARAVSIEQRGNYMASLALNGTIRLYDLSVVRRGTAQPVKLKRSMPHALQELDASLGGSNAAGVGRKARGGGRALQGARQQQQARGGGQACAGGGGHVQSADQNGGDDSNTLRPPRRAAMSKPLRDRQQQPLLPTQGRPPAAAARPAMDAAAVPADLLTADPLAQRFNRARLQTLLNTYGEYPAKYRLMIWEFHLQLPHNSAAFQGLKNKGDHLCVADLAERYPLSDAKVARNLARTVSLLAHWCPLFGEVSFLPTVVFPFVKLFQSSAEAAFEAVATVLTNWAASWFEAFPGPPLAHLSGFTRLLQHHDTALAEHMSRWPGGCAAPAWELASSLLTEVFNRGEWLKVWDHVLSNQPEFLTHVLVSYLVSSRAALLASTSPAEAPPLATRPPDLDVNAVIRRAYVMFEASPEHVRPNCPVFAALPPGEEYPKFDAFPAASVRVERGQRERIAVEESRVRQRKEQLDSLHARGRTLEQKAAEVGREREQLTVVAAERRSTVRALEQNLLQEQVRLDSVSKAERIRQIALIEDQYRSHLQLMQEEMRSEVDRLAGEVAHKQASRAAELRSRAEDERILALEFEARQRMWAIEQAQMRQAATQRLRTQAEAKEMELQIRQQQALADMGSKDEALALKTQHEAARHSRLAALAAEARAQAETDLELVKQELEQETQLRTVQQQQTLRHLAEAEALATQEAVDAERERLQTLAAQDTERLRARIANDRAWLEEEQLLRDAAVAQEREALAASKEARLALYHDIDRGARVREGEQASAEVRRLLERQNQAEAANTRSLVSKLERERLRDTEMRMALLLKEEELKARAASATEAARAEGAPEGARPARNRQQASDYLDEAAAKEGELKRQHEAMLAELALERQRQLDSLDAVWRDQRAPGSSGHTHQRGSRDSDSERDSPTHQPHAHRGGAGRGAASASVSSSATSAGTPGSRWTDPLLTAYLRSSVAPGTALQHTGGTDSERRPARGADGQGAYLAPEGTDRPPGDSAAREQGAREHAEDAGAQVPRQYIGSESQEQRGSRDGGRQDRPPFPQAVVADSQLYIPSANSGGASERGPAGWPPPEADAGPQRYVPSADSRGASGQPLPDSWRAEGVGEGGRESVRGELAHVRGMVDDLRRMRDFVLANDADGERNPGEALQHLLHTMGVEPAAPYVPRETVVTPSVRAQPPLPGVSESFMAPRQRVSSGGASFYVDASPTGLRGRRATSPAPARASGAWGGPPPPPRRSTYAGRPASVQSAVHAYNTRRPSGLQQGARQRTPGVHRSRDARSPHRTLRGEPWQRSPQHTPQRSPRRSPQRPERTQPFQMPPSRGGSAQRSPGAEQRAAPSPQRAPPRRSASKVPGLVSEELLEQYGARLSSQRRTLARDSCERAGRPADSRGPGTERSNSAPSDSIDAAAHARNHPGPAHAHAAWSDSTGLSTVEPEEHGAGGSRASGMARRHDADARAQHELGQRQQEDPRLARRHTISDSAPASRLRSPAQSRERGTTGAPVLAGQGVGTGPVIAAQDLRTAMADLRAQLGMPAQSGTHADAEARPRAASSARAKDVLSQRAHDFAHRAPDRAGVWARGGNGGAWEYTGTRETVRATPAASPRPRAPAHGSATNASHGQRRVSREASREASDETRANCEGAGDSQATSPSELLDSESFASPREWPSPDGASRLPIVPEDQRLRAGLQAYAGYPASQALQWHQETHTYTETRTSGTSVDMLEGSDGSTSLSLSIGPDALVSGGRWDARQQQRSSYTDQSLGTAASSSGVAPTLRPDSLGHASNALSIESSHDPLSTPKKKQRGQDALDGSPSQRRTDQEVAPELYGMSPGSNVTESLDLSLGMGGGTASRSQAGRGASNWLDNDDDDATTVAHSEM